MVKKRKSIHYVNNKEFSTAVVEYVKLVNEAKENRANQLPIVPDYIAICFMRIAEGLSHKSNFVGYTYREEMVMDAVENCLKAILNYNIEAATRTGAPNAFAYFTQITWYAFLRRIAKEKKQQDVKMRYLSTAGAGDFLSTDSIANNNMGDQVINHYVNVLQMRINTVKEKDKVIKAFVVKDKKATRKKKVSLRDSDLSEFLA
jgi:hypothetical protein